MGLLITSSPRSSYGGAPGNGRSTPPLSHADFVQKMWEWVNMGAACPERSEQPGKNDKSDG